MFKLFKKKREKENIDKTIINLMYDYSNEVDKSYRRLILKSKENYPNEKIELSTYGLYKARFGTNLMIAAGAHLSKKKIGFGKTKDFYNDIQIASAIGHKPFSSKNSKQYLDPEKLSRRSEEIIKFLIENLKNGSEEIFDLSYSENDEFYKKLTLYFHNAVSESIADNNLTRQIIDSNEEFFEILILQNIEIMSECMRL